MKFLWTQLLREGEQGRLAIFAAVLLAAVLGVFALADSLGISFAQDSAADAELVLSVKAGSTPCATSAPGEVCVPLNGDFTLSVDGIDVPDAGYTLVDTWVHYWSNITYNADPTVVNEIVWPECNANVALRITSTPEHVGHGCISGVFPPLPVSTYTGNLVDLSMTCSASGSSQIIELVGVNTPPAGSSGSLFKDNNSQDVIPKLDTLYLNCGPGGALATDTFTPTYTPTNTPTFTPTFTPTPTNTPTPPPGPLMSFNAEVGDNIGCATPTPTPTPVAKPSNCLAKYWPGQEKRGEFTVFVNANRIPTPDGYGGFRSEVFVNGDLTYNPRPDCTDEVVWPDALDSTCDRPLTDPIRHEVYSASAPAYPLSDYHGPLVALDMHCSSAGDGQLQLSLEEDPDSPFDGSTYYGADGQDGGDDAAFAVSAVDPPYADILNIDCGLQPSEMSLGVEGDGVTCDVPDKPNKCTAPYEEDATGDPVKHPFYVTVDANAIPDGYGGFQTEVWYTGLQYDARSCGTEITWRPDFAPAFTCSHGEAPSGTGATLHRVDRLVAHGDALVPYPESKAVGGLAQIELSCKSPGLWPVWLTKYSNTFTPQNDNGSAFLSTGGVRSAPGLPVTGTDETAFIDRNGDGYDLDDNDGEYYISDVLTINCETPPEPTITPIPTATVPPTATPCDGPCPTPTATNTPTSTDTPTMTNTPTITDTPTITPTPAPADFAGPTEVGPGGKIATGTAATEGDPVETSVTVPIGGVISITEKSIVQPDPAGYHLFGQQVNISAPPSTSQFPLVIQFWLDASIIDPGVNANNVALFKNGHLVPNCTGPATKASPDPCISKRNLLVAPQEGDIQLTVNSTTASAWNFGQATGTPQLGDVDGNGIVDPLDALWVLYYSSNIAVPPFPGVADVNGDGVVDPVDASLILQLTAGIIDSFPAGQPSGIAWSWFNF